MFRNTAYITSHTNPSTYGVSALVLILSAVFVLVVDWIMSVSNPAITLLEGLTGVILFNASVFSKKASFNVFFVKSSKNICGYVQT